MTTPIVFDKLTASELNPGAIVPQALDNQWSPSDVLRKELIKKQKPLTKWEGREKAVLSEWRRALVYSPQVIVNRAFLFNNSVVVNDYSGENKKYFRELLSRKVIVDYLLTEDGPDQRPTFKIHDEKWAKWLELIQDVDTKMGCVRLDWGKQDDDFRNLASVFHEYIQTLNLQDRTNHLINAFRIPQSRQKQFREKLIEVARYAFEVASQGKTIVRNSLYEKYVCAAGTAVDDGIYDPKKEFAAELKEIFDLRYVVNLPDALGRYAFTPKGSPDRTLLGDVSQSSIQSLLREDRINDFIDALKRLQFTMLNDALYIKGLELLSLEDVLKIRDTDEWGKYIASLNSLLSAPLDFAERVDDVSANFTLLNRKITDLKVKTVQGGASEIVTRWQPRMMILVALGGAVLKFTTDSDEPRRILVETLSGPIAVGLTPMAVNLQIEAKQKIDLGISINFMRSKVKNGKDVWGEMMVALEKDQRFKMCDIQESSGSRVADQSRNDNDWNDIV